VAGVGNTTLAFDKAGNMLTDERGQQYKYDAWNRLVQVKDAGNAVIASYSYDALRRRVTETHGNTTGALYYSSQWQVMEERNAATGNTTMSYAWSPVYVDAMISRDRDTDNNGSLDERLWVQQDANWNVTSIVDGSGAVERYVHDAYGVRTVYSADYSTVRSVSDYDWHYEFQGLRRDAATGNFHARNRDYDAELGRLTQSDPIGFSGGNLNLYGFVSNEPTMGVDPSGLHYPGPLRESDGGLPSWMYPPSDMLPKPWPSQGPRPGEDYLDYIKREFGITPPGTYSGTYPRPDHTYTTIGPITEQARRNTEYMLQKQREAELNGLFYGYSMYVWNLLPGSVPGGRRADSGCSPRTILSGPPGPANYPKPVGINPFWGRGPPSGEKPGGWRWWDGQGGEWRWHPADKHHPKGHWDYNPWDAYHSPWQIIYLP